MRLQKAGLLLTSIVLGPTVQAQPSYRLVTSDISAFYRAVDAAKGGDSVAYANAFRSEYLKKGSDGLREFVLIRLGRQTAMATVQQLGWDRERTMKAMGAAPGSSDRAVFDTLVLPRAYEEASRGLARTYLSRRAYYDAIRPNLMAVDTAARVKSAIKAAFDKMRQLYPEATYPDVYFVVGRLATGGTTFGDHLLIGTEIYGRDPSTPIGELSDWEKGVTGQADQLPVIVAHEYAHTLQGAREGSGTLLRAALGEGSADFIAELIAGAHILNPAYEYGDAHVPELWSEFKVAMDSTDMSKWLYNGSASKDRPADLGYWIGYRIAKAYYDKASDKTAAVRDILLFRDAKDFLSKSGFDGSK